MRRLLALMMIALFAGCIPARVKELNALGHKAVAAHRYDQAVSYLSESLAIYPDQPKVALQLEAAKTMLKQIYVFKIYELVDGPKQPVETYVQVWKISSQLPKLNVAPARVASIRVDLNKKFVAEEPRLRSITEPHSYFLHLTAMDRLVPSPPVARTRGEVAALLQQHHLEAQRKADAARLEGLGLLHTAAAATFAPGDTGLWVEVKRRQDALRDRLGIRVDLLVRPTGHSPASSRQLLGGLRRRLPRIFFLKEGAPMRLTLGANRPTTNQRQVGDRHSAQCQVATRQEPNPECDSLKNRAEMAKRTLEGKLSALQTAQERCGAAQQATSCTGYLSSARSDVDSARRSYEDLEGQVGRCPRFIEKPVFKTFFYQRFTMTRSASATGAVTLERAGAVLRSRNVAGAASATDTYGEGLSCASIPPDPLNLPDLDALLGQAEERMLDHSMGELFQMRRELAQKQMAGGSSTEARLDSLVRARVVDESWRQVAGQLSDHLKGMWSSDFDLPRRIVQ
jgi:hypothetical protein